MKKLPISLLYVEDDPVLQNVYQRILTKAIDKIYFANNGEEGVRLFEKQLPDLILTDIRMPVMNGLDMIRKIRRKHPKIRVIILSAYGDSRYFSQAIELGVKGFLLKPADTKRLLSLVNEQAEEVRLEWNLQQEEEKRREAEQARRKSESILRALVHASASFFHQGFKSYSIRPIMQSIGEATDSSRVYIFQNSTKGGERYSSQIYEWTAPGIEPQIDNPELNNVPFRFEAFAEWVEAMEKGKNVFGLVKDFINERLRKILTDQNILSILVIPIYVNEDWWGFVGLDDCQTERIWSEPEVKALEALANNLGAAIYRQNVEMELVQLNASLENRVKKRTKELEMEVTERKLTEMLLRDSEEKYRLIFENANSAILLIREGVVILVNPKAVEIYGYLPKQMIGKPLSTFTTRYYKNIVKKCYEAENVVDKCSTQDVKIVSSDGTEKWVEIKSNEIIWDDKDSFLLFISDITAKKIAEQSLSQLNRSLEARIREKVKHLEQQQQLLMQKSKLESMGELSAGLAHEINQPLVGISMGLDNILMKIATEGMVENEYIENKFKFLFEDIQRINKIIQHVRLFSREQAFNIEDEIDINQVIENALSMMKMQLEHHLVTIEMDLSEEPITLLGNQFRLEQVLVNLLSNAKYAVEEKERRQKTREYNKKIRIKSYSDEKNAFIILQDNGIGIASEIIQKIFNPFFTTKSENQGTGLGLSISYGIIQEMNGEIYVESKINRETTFTVELPLI